MKKNDWILVISVLAYSLLFYKQLAGLNFLLFNIILLIGLIVKNTSIIKDKKWILLASGTLITSTCVAYYSNALSITANIISMGILSAYSMSRYSSLIFAFLFSMYSIALSSVFICIDWIKRITTKNELKPNKQTRSILLIIIPMIVTSIFFVMYRDANPIFNDLMNKINFDFISFSWILFTLGGILLMYGFYSHKSIRVIADFDKNGNNHLIEKNHKSFEFLGKEISLPDEVFSGKLMFILLNILLLFVNILDAKFLFVDHKLPKGISPSAFVHQGTNTIIFSILFAIIIILFYFRGSLNFYKNNTLLKIFAYAWIVQNVFLLVSTMMRNNIYVFDFGLTYKRIGVYIYLGLCIIGLILTVIKIAKIKSNHFLFRANAWVFYAVLILSCLVNWDHLITHFNMTTSKNLEKKYLLHLSYTNIPALIQLRNDTITFNDAKLNTDDSYDDEYRYNNELNFSENLDRKIYLFLQDRNQRNWKSWYAENDVIYNAILKQCKQSNDLSISLYRMNLANVDTIPAYADLKSIDLTNNSITDLSSLKQFKNVTRMNLSNTLINTIQDIDYFQKLEFINLSETPLDDYTPLLKLVNMKEIIVSKNISKNDLELLRSKMTTTKIEAM
jgi:hypothetical protein